MMRLWYWLSNARFIERLYGQQKFEMMFGANVMRSGRARRRVSALSWERGYACLGSGEKP